MEEKNLAMLYVLKKHHVRYVCLSDQGSLSHCFYWTPHPVVCPVVREMLRFTMTIGE